MFPWMIVCGSSNLHRAYRKLPGDARKRNVTHRGRRMSVTLSWKRPRWRTPTSGYMKYTPRRPCRLRSRCGEDTSWP